MRGSAGAPRRRSFCVCSSRVMKLRMLVTCDAVVARKPLQHCVLMCIDDVCECHVMEVI